MANMDYPGPCLSCHDVNGCVTEETIKQAAADYCDNVQQELNVRKANLYDAAVRFIGHGNADRVRIVDSVAEMKAIIQDIEAKAAQFDNECPLEVPHIDPALLDAHNRVGVHHNRALEVIAAGSFGG